MGSALDVGTLVRLGTREGQWLISTPKNEDGLQYVVRAADGACGWESSEKLELLLRPNPQRVELAEDLGRYLRHSNLGLASLCSEAVEQIERWKKQDAEKADDTLSLFPGKPEELAPAPTYDFGPAQVDVATLALRNMGHDTTCGACMEVAFTGATGHLHTCAESQEQGKIAAFVRARLAAVIDRLDDQEYNAAREAATDLFVVVGDSDKFAEAVDAHDLEGRAVWLPFCLSPDGHVQQWLPGSATAAVFGHAWAGGGEAPAEGDWVVAVQVDGSHVRLRMDPVS